MNKLRIGPDETLGILHNRLVAKRLMAALPQPASARRGVIMAGVRGDTLETDPIRPHRAEREIAPRCLMTLTIMGPRSLLSMPATGSMALPDNTKT